MIRFLLGALVGAAAVYLYALIQSATPATDPDDSDPPDWYTGTVTSGDIQWTYNTTN